MRKATFSGTAMGLTWSRGNSGFIRSDGLITEILLDQLLDGDPNEARVAGDFEGLPGSGVKPVLLTPVACEPDVLRVTGRVVSQVGARALVHPCHVPDAGTPELDLLVEQLRTVQDLVPLPMAVDPAVRLDQDPGNVAMALREICERVWCTFVLDLTSLQEFAAHRDVRPETVIANLPPSRVAYIRIRSTTSRPVTSSVKELVTATVSRWEEHVPPIVLSSDRPANTQVRELNELMTLTGHRVNLPEWSRLEVADRAETVRRNS